MRIAAAVLLLLVGCKALETQVDIKILVPEDDTPLDATDNVSVTLTPDGFSETIGVDGLDFSLEVELDPDQTERKLAVFMADGEELLAYGETPPFTYGLASASGLTVFAAYAGGLSTFPVSFDLPDESLRAAYVPAVGIVALGGDGSTIFVDEYTYDFVTASELVHDRGVPAPDDGAFVGDAQAGANRLSWDQEISGFRFDVRVNAWRTLELRGAEEAGIRTGAAHLRDPDDDRVFVFGGGDRTDVVTIELLPGEDEDAVSTAEGMTLDGPRPGATATWVRREDDDSLSAVLMGGDAELPLVYVESTREAVGPTGDWSQGRCVQIDRGSDEQWLRVLCGGGLRDAEPTADAVLVTLPPVDSDESPVAEELPDFLAVALGDPIWLEDDDAVYAQGEGSWLRVDRTDLAVAQPPANPVRGRGGDVVRVGSRASFLFGGTTVQGAPVGEIQVFAPASP